MELQGTRLNPPDLHIESYVREEKLKSGVYGTRGGKHLWGLEGQGKGIVMGAWHGNWHGNWHGEWHGNGHDDWLTIRAAASGMANGMRDIGRRRTERYPR